MQLCLPQFKMRLVSLFFKKAQAPACIPILKNVCFGVSLRINQTHTNRVFIALDEASMKYRFVFISWSYLFHAHTLYFMFAMSGGR